VNDTLRIVDRERGQIFEGSAAEQFLSEQLAMDFGVGTALALGLGGRRGCDDIDEVILRSGSGVDVVAGRVRGEGFRVEFLPDGGPIRKVLWPVPDDPSMGDRLKVEYDWRPTSEGPMALRQIIIHLEEREWRCKLVSTNL
jgi:hypothetical protein